MYLVVDVGNSLIKVAFFNHFRLINSVTFNLTEITSAINFLKTKEIKTEKAIISSVTPDSVPLQKWMEMKLQTIVFNPKLKLPFNNLYKTPDTLGHDRIANAAAAVALFPNKNVLVIDAGTALKFDFIDSKKNYYGGSISPGMQMRFEALNKFTGKLPLVKFKNQLNYVGKSTDESIRAGVQFGIINETEGMISHYKKEYKNLIVILTGGDYRFFANHVKTRIFARPKFTLEGLYELLKYQLND